MKEFHEFSAEAFKLAIIVYKIRLDLGPHDKLQWEREQMVHLLDNLLADESCPKLLYLYLIKTCGKSDIKFDQINDIFAKYFEKFNFRYGFHDDEIKQLNHWFKQFKHRRSATRILDKLAEQFNSLVASKDYKEVLKTDLVKTLEIASSLSGYDSRSLNDVIGKQISKTMLDENILE